MRTNRDHLVEISVMGEIAHPAYGKNPYQITAEGKPVILVGSGGITYNVRVGDSATAFKGDHVEPAVSIKHPQGDGFSGANAGLNVLACIGNPARVSTGEAKGHIGLVTGKHGGAERVMIDFPPATLDQLVIGDTIMIRASGVGLELLDFPEIHVFNLSPQLLDVWPMTATKKHLEVPVTHRIPAAIMGSGLGRDNVARGDYDITLFDPATREAHDLDHLRLGDLVLIEDADHQYGRIYRQGYHTIGVIIHGSSVVAGHGPGLTTLMTGPASTLKPQLDDTANLAHLFKLRDDLD